MADKKHTKLQSALAVGSGALEPEVRKFVEGLVEKISSSIPSDHPLRSSLTERVTGVGKALYDLYSKNPFSERITDFMDFGSQNFFNGVPATDEWWEEFSLRAEAQLDAATDDNKASISEKLQQEVADRKETMSMLAQLHTDYLGEQETPVSDFFTEQVAPWLIKLKEAGSKELESITDMIVAFRKSIPKKKPRSEMTRWERFKDTLWPM